MTTILWAIVSVVSVLAFVVVAALWILDSALASHARRSGRSIR